ncbi:MAG: PrsW family glutamic-type intramembrane protease [Acidobacteriota bacterium]
MAVMKLTLTLNEGTLAGRSYELESGFLTVGRGETCSVRFDPVTERIASKQHAFIEAKVDGYYLTDNQSTNGTFLNGGRITQVTKLSSGDTIQFGRNGATAAIAISEQPAAGQASQAFESREAFREHQVDQFNQLANSQPISVQESITSFGLSKVETTPASAASKTGKYVGIGVTLFVIGFLILIVIGLMFLSVGPIAAIFAAFVAFIPACIYVLPIIWLDRYDPEPVWLLALAFAWGALVAVTVSFVVNTLISVIATIGISPAAGQIIGGVISAPIFEEGSKGLGLLVLLIFFRKYFDDILDGLVFAGVIALGFATVENVLYYGNAINGSQPGMMGVSLGLSFFMRGILSPFAHVTFTSMTGIGCGISRESHNKFVRIIAPFIGYCCAVFLHAFWNGMAFIGGLGAFIVGYLILEVPFFLIFVGFAFYIMHRQNRILKEMLAIDIARGLIPTEHGRIATSAFSSSAWLIGGIFAGKFRARSNYVRAMGKLGLSYWHIQRATKAQGNTASFQQNPILRDEVLKWRDLV